MKEVVNISNDFFNSYLENNRTKIDEALVSLRLMKEIDDFLEINNINQRDFSNQIGYSEAYISQLMSGVKKINTSFINRIEKRYNLKIQFKIQYRDYSNFISKVSNSTIDISIHMNNFIESKNVFSFENNYNEFSEIDSDLLKLEINEQ